MTGFHLSGPALMLLTLTVATAHAAPPTPKAVNAMRSKLEAMRKALTEHGGQLTRDEMELLSTRLGHTEVAFKQYIALAERGNARLAATAPLYAAGAVIIGDDVSGVGVADDVLLPFVGVALLIACVATLPPPSERELAAAWAGVLASLQALAQAVTDVAAQRKAGCYCRCFRAGRGPDPHKRVDTPSECLNYCKDQGYNGYQCGGPVTWWN